MTFWEIFLSLPIIYHRLRIICICDLLKQHTRCSFLSTELKLLSVWKKTTEETTKYSVKNLLLIAVYKKNNGENNTYNTKNLLVLLEQKLMSVYKKQQKKQQNILCKKLVAHSKDLWLSTRKTTGNTTHTMQKTCWSFLNRNWCLFIKNNWKGNTIYFSKNLLLIAKTYACV